MRLEPSPRSVEASRSCLVATQHLSHYRAGVYAAMQEAANWDFSFLASVSTGDSGIPEVPPGLLRTVHRVGEHRVAGRFLWQGGLVTHLLFSRYDVVILSGNATHLSTWVGATVTRLKGTPVVFWTMGWRKRDRSWLRRLLRRSFYYLADHLMVYGADGYRLGRSEGFPGKRMSIIGNSYSDMGSADQLLTAEASAVLRLPENSSRVYVGAVVRLTDNRRFELLIGAVRILRQSGLDLGIILTGEGEAEPSIRDLAARADVPLVLTGAIHSRVALEDVYARLAVTVIPEWAGLTVVQSLTFGIPVITSDASERQGPEVEAIRPGITGDRYRAGDAVHLAERIRHWLERLAQEGPVVKQACQEEVARNWSVEAHAARVLECLEEVCGIRTRNRLKARTLE